MQIFVFVSKAFFLKVILTFLLIKLIIYQYLSSLFLLLSDFLQFWSTPVPTFFLFLFLVTETLERLAFKKKKRRSEKILSGTLDILNYLKEGRREKILLSSSYLWSSICYFCLLRFSPSKFIPYIRLHFSVYCLFIFYGSVPWLFFLDGRGIFWTFFFEVMTLVSRMCSFRLSNLYIKTTCLIIYISFF